jgi:hypothetical protein
MSYHLHEERVEFTKTLSRPLEVSMILAHTAIGNGAIPSLPTDLFTSLETSPAAALASLDMSGANPNSPLTWAVSHIVASNSLGPLLCPLNPWGAILPKSVHGESGSGVLCQESSILPYSWDKGGRSKRLSDGEEEFVVEDSEGVSDQSSISYNLLSI